MQHPKILQLSLLFTILGVGLPACEGCSETELSLVQGALRIDPNEVNAGPVPKLGSKALSITLANIGLQPINITSLATSNRSGSSESGLEFSDALVSIPPEQSIELVITIRPEDLPLGLTERIVRVGYTDPELSEQSITLRFDVVECDDENACTTDELDPISGECIFTFNDGASCDARDLCIVDGQCNQGVCLGEPKNCGDNNPCTRDLCNQADGTCFYESDSSVCNDQNPCTEDTCSLEGCSYTQLTSGTPCDDGDECTIDEVCLLGECQGSALADGVVCNDQNSCTVNDACLAGACTGENLIEQAEVGDVVFRFPLRTWPQAFLHRREVSLGPSGTLYGLDHLSLDEGLAHVAFSVEQCGTPGYEFEYVPPDAATQVSFVRRAIQIDQNDNLRLVVGVRQLPGDGYRPQTTTYRLRSNGEIIGEPDIQRLGGETGRALLPDGSQVYGVVFPITEGGLDPDTYFQNLVIVREDINGAILWRHDRTSGPWAEFLGVAGPRVLFWSDGRFGALDFNTGATAWTRATNFTSDEMALSTLLNIGVIRTRPLNQMRSGGQLIAVEILEGRPVFEFPPEPDDLYFPRTEPVIYAEGTIGVLMQTNLDQQTPSWLTWVELTERGEVIRETTLPYTFPVEFASTRHRDIDDPFPTVADDGTVYIGYGNQLFAIAPDGGGLSWTITSTLSDNAFTGSVPLLRDDGVLLINEASRQIIGVKTNGGKISESGWPAFRHDGRRTNFTPSPP